MNDFFLIERAAQVQRLYRQGQGNRFQIPTGMSRVGYTRTARRLFRSIELIDDIPLGKKRKRLLSQLAERGAEWFGLRRGGDPDGDESLQLTAKHRQVLRDFDHLTVDFELESGPSAGGEIVVGRSLWADRDGFDGLKPIAQHSTKLAHELLFPSWFNLYTALRHPTGRDSKRWSDAQIASLFQFLAGHESSLDSDAADEVVGIFTLLANRMPGRRGQVLMQQLIDGLKSKNREQATVCPETFRRLRESTDSAAKILAGLQALAVFDAAAAGKQSASSNELKVRLPKLVRLPRMVVERVAAALNDSNQPFPETIVWIDTVAKFSLAGGKIEPEYSSLLQRHCDQFGTYLGFLLPPDTLKPLSGCGQRMLVDVAKAVAASPQRIRPQADVVMATRIAPRLDVMHPQAVSHFDREFVQREDNLAVFLECFDHPEGRATIAQQLIDRARKLSDPTRLWNFLAIAAAIDPQKNVESLTAMGRTIRVLCVLEEKAFISSSQLDGLAADIRSRLPESLNFLECPGQGAHGLRGRLAKLYLALQEECERFAHTGEIGNYGLTNAAYGNLDRSVDREL